MAGLGAAVVANVVSSYGNCGLVTFFSRLHAISGVVILVEGTVICRQAILLNFITLPYARGSRKEM